VLEWNVICGLATARFRSPDNIPMPMPSLSPSFSVMSDIRFRSFALATFFREIAARSTRIRDSPGSTRRHGDVKRVARRRRALTLQAETTMRRPASCAFDAQAWLEAAARAYAAGAI